MTMTYFTAKSTYVTHAFEWGKLFKFRLNEKSLQEMSKWTEDLWFQKNWTPGVGLFQPRGNNTYLLPWN